MCADGVLFTHSRRLPRGQISGKRNKNHSFRDELEKITVESRMMISTNPSSKLTTSPCLVAIVMTKMKTNALWKKDSIAILWKRQVDVHVLQAFKLLIAPLSDLLLWRDRFVSTFSDCCTLLVPSFACLLRFHKSHCADSVALEYLLQTLKVSLIFRSDFCLVV